MNYRKDPNRENNSMVLEWTGERYLPFVDPKICGDEIHYEHLHRYYFALHFVKDKKVLDLTCGDGYGSYILSKILSENFWEIIGVEMYKDFINAFQDLFYRKDVDYDYSEKLSRRMRKI